MDPKVGKQRKVAEVQPSTKSKTLMPSLPPDAIGSALDKSALHLLHRAAQGAEELFTREFAKWDLTPRQYAVLVAAQENEGKSQTAIVQTTGIDRSTLADLVRRLVKKGLLHRRRTKADARAYAVRLTEAGRQLIESSRSLAGEVDEQILGMLDPSEREHLTALLATLVAKMRKRGDA